MANIRYVTGVNAEYFFILFPLFASLRRFAPGIRVEVCDFGLSEKQRIFLDRKGLLIRAPADLAGAHPWRCKAALGRYLEDRPWDVAFWLDADMMAAAPCGSQLTAIAERLLAEGRPLAVCRDSTTYADLLRVVPAPHFEKLAKARGIDAGTPYLNSGFFACASREYFTDWDRQCRDMPDENLFEQNAFNLVAHPAGYLALHMWEWNLCASFLSSARVGQTDEGMPLITHPEGGVRILHATSHRPEDVVKQVVTLSAGGFVFEATIKLLRHPSLLQWQMSLLRDGLEADAALLGEVGLGRPDDGGDADDAEAKARFQQGGEMFLLNRFAEAADAFRDVLRLKPGHPRSLFNLAMAEAELGRLAEAPPLLRQAIQSDPQYREAYIYLGMMLRRLGEHAAADEILARALAKWPEDPALRQAIGH
ncbi:hypothetical protein WV31_19770 [Magnetospirillum sp. ME-1]|uniref:tetratricopeptide repeat protein n=1 Tax=Magnetospirillum sp. ME-1 TaxID=1639348 RepID=UPI000A17D420|nr:tetratricopeptide repeat protein [Magnetospirillum sp. ME-1]ARJ67734.1 hypothetical protein WV31_19770 [Magnetospirillum sp. ME-1]